MRSSAPGQPPSTHRLRVFAELCDEVRFDQPLASYTTYGCGGRADVWAAPREPEQIVSLLAACRELGIPSVTVGGGSNVLVSDDGFRGLVIHTRNLRGLQARDGYVLAGGGALNSRLLAEAIRQGWAGVEFLSGLPGTIGGGVAMNAGTPQGCFQDVVRAVTIADAQQLRELTHEQIGFRYRGTALPPGSVVVSAKMVMAAGEPAQIRATADALRERRKRTQPYGQRSAGSVFKNPPGDYAGRLIESLGLKGASVGQARVSPIHANFIVASAGTRARDVYHLMEYVRQRVQQEYAIALESEVKLLGDFPRADELDPREVKL